MGQMTYGISYGCEANDEFSSEEILEKYEETGNDPPRFEGENNPAFFGYSIAVGASGRLGVPNLESFQIDSLDAKYHNAMKNAIKQWNVFAKWCKSEGIDLPKPHLWLVEMEVA